MTASLAFALAAVQGAPTGGAGSMLGALAAQLRVSRAPGARDAPATIALAAGYSCAATATAITVRLHGAR